MQLHSVRARRGQRARGCTSTSATSASIARSRAPPDSTAAARGNDAELFAALRDKDAPAVHELTAALPGACARRAARARRRCTARPTRRSRPRATCCRRCPTSTAALDALAFLAAHGHRRCDAIHVDLADLRGYHYYTGATFSVFAQGERGAIIDCGRGGRYDGVGRAFGRARPATGFSLDLRRLAGARRRRRPQAASIHAPDDAGSRARARRSPTLRAQGEAVVSRCRVKRMQAGVGSCRTADAGGRGEVMGKNVVVIGTQWGDEGKGKIVDWLTESAIGCGALPGRPQRRAHAGDRRQEDGAAPHSVGRAAPGRRDLRRQRRRAVAVARCCRRSASSKAAGVDVRSRLKISPACPLVLPIHVALDQAREAAMGETKIGTTGRGIGPAYEDKIARRALRVQDLLDPGAVRREARVAARAAQLHAGQLLQARPGARSRRRATRRSRTRRSSRRWSADVAGTAAAGARCAASRCCSKARRARCSTSTTARIRTSRARTASRAPRRPAAASARTCSTTCSAS